TPPTTASPPGRARSLVVGPGRRSRIPAGSRARPGARAAPRPHVEHRAEPETRPGSDSGDPGRRRALDTANDGFAAGACSIAAGVLHVAASQTHLDLTTLSRLFLATGVAQIIAGGALLLTPSRRVALATIAVNLAAFGAWLVTRFVDIGFIEGLEVAEAPQLADLLTAGLAAASVLLLSVSRSWRDGLDRSVKPDPGPARLATVGVVAVALVAIGGLGSHDHAGADDGEGAGQAWRLGATEAELADTERLVVQTQAEVETYESIEQAEEEGFVRINDQHLLNVSRVFDEHQLDPEHIESLVVAQRDGEDYISGGMYLMDVGQTMRDVPRIGGPLMVWHTHGGFCFRANGVIEAGPEAEGTCPAESIWLDDPPMLHIYTERQVDEEGPRTRSDCGTFAFMDLPFDQAVPGCGGAHSHSDHDHAAH
ncbi:MAG: hypothetical protein AAGK32_08550, partial [Actinomycetota bacterium]